MEFITKDLTLHIEKTLICAILNATPDSFSDGGENYGIDKALKKARNLIDQGVDMIDIGGESTRPGSTYVEIQEEIDRVVPLIRAIRKESDIAISVDTWKAQVADQALKAGANIINDITGLLGDPNMAQVVADHKAGLILMFNPVKIRPNHQAAQVFPNFGDQVFDQDQLDAYQDMDILDLMDIYFDLALDLAKKAGLKKDQIMLDPGVGFGLTPEENLRLIANIERIHTRGYMAYLGVSRKRFISAMIKDLGLSIDLKDPQGRSNADLGSAILTARAVMDGVEAVRVHSIKEHLIARQVATALGQEDSKIKSRRPS